MYIYIYIYTHTLTHTYETNGLPWWLVKNLPAMQETLVWSLGCEDLLEKGMATHSSILAWRIPWIIQPMGLQRVIHDWATSTWNVGYVERIYVRGVNVKVTVTFYIKTYFCLHSHVLHFLPSGLSLTSPSLHSPILTNNSHLRTLSIEQDSHFLQVDQGKRKEVGK